MVKLFTTLCAVALIAGCGETRYSSNNASGVRSFPQSSTVLFASGPIAAACQKAGRKQASRARCGCVQAVANRSLNAVEQRRGAAFFSDPQDAQDTRQSDNAASERFWRKWKDYSTEAGRICT